MCKQQHFFGKVCAFWVACRPKTLAIGFWPSVLGVLFGVKNVQNATSESPTTALLDQWFLVLVLVLLGVLIQSLANLANDYFDFVQGADGTNRIGPKRALQSGLLSKAEAKIGMAFLTGLVLFLGCLLGLRVHWFVGVLVLVAVCMAFGYTYGRFSMAYLGTADVFAFLMFGPVPTAVSAWVVGNAWDLGAVFVGVGLGAQATSILALNNLRDEVADRGSQKKTLVVRLGSRFGKVEFVFFSLVGVLFYPSLQVAQGNLAWLLGMAVLVVALPVALKVVAGPRQDEWNVLLQRTVWVLHVHAATATVLTFFLSG